MTEQEDKHKKVPITTYSLGKGDYFMVSPTTNGYHCWGYVANEHIEIEKENLAEISKEIINKLEKAKINYQNKTNRIEEIALRIKENGLEKTAKELGEIKERE